MTTLKTLCIPRTFEHNTDDVQDITDLIENRINPALFF